MSDMRFTLIGVGLIFVGFVSLGVFGPAFVTVTIESQQFGDCYEYFEDRPPVKTSCDSELFDKVLFFGLVIGLVASGIVSLIKGVKGGWDQQVNPQDMVGPGKTDNDSTESEK